MGGYYERLGEIDKAIAAYQRAISVDKNNSYLHLCLSSAYLKKNDLDKATEALNKATYPLAERIMNSAVSQALRERTVDGARELATSEL